MVDVKVGGGVNELGVAGVGVGAARDGSGGLPPVGRVGLPGITTGRVRLVGGAVGVL